jgi:hypothetical protein
MIKINSIGIIAEEESDFNSIKVLVGRIVSNGSLKFNGFHPGGCSKIKRKAGEYANILATKGCNMLIFVHDLDRNDLKKLKKEIEEKLKGNPIENCLICIPIEEIEAWFLSDQEGIKKIFKLEKFQKIKGLPEEIISPKESLEKCIRWSSNKKIYLTTSHNEILASKLSIEKMKQKCPSFKDFYIFLKQYKY